MCIYIYIYIYTHIHTQAVQRAPRPGRVRADAGGPRVHVRGAPPPALLAPAVEDRLVRAGERGLCRAAVRRRGALEEARARQLPVRAAAQGSLAAAGEGSASFRTANLKLPGRRLDPHSFRAAGAIRARAVRAGYSYAY